MTAESRQYYRVGLRIDGDRALNSALFWAGITMAIGALIALSNEGFFIVAAGIAGLKAIGDFVFAYGLYDAAERPILANIDALPPSQTAQSSVSENGQGRTSDAALSGPGSRKPSPGGLGPSDFDPSRIGGATS